MQTNVHSLFLDLIIPKSLIKAKLKNCYNKSFLMMRKKLVYPRAPIFIFSHNSNIFFDLIIIHIHACYNFFGIQIFVYNTYAQNVPLFGM